MDKNTLLSQRLSGINWFYWITGLSLINTLVNFSDGSYSFIVGLGYTQFIDATALLFRNEGNMIMMTGIFFLSLFVSGFFAIAGHLTELGKKGWYLAAMILYALDMLIYLYIEDFVAIGFHIFALVYIYRGYTAYMQLLKEDQSESED